jgi:sporulation protein YlmC with PRC-barrel domain
MLLSELLDLEVRDAQGQRLGTVVDVRLAAPPDDHQQVPTRVLGFVISPGTRTSYLGFERTNVTGPWVLARIIRWWHRGTFLAGWEDVARIDENCITLRSGFRRYSARLGLRTASQV